MRPLGAEATLYSALGSATGYGSALVVSRMNRAAHHHDLSELLERPQIAPRQRLDVAERRERDERDLSRALVRLLAQEFDGVWCGRGVGRTERPLLLGEGHRVGGRRPLGDHDVLAAERREQPAHQECARAGVSPGGRDADHLKTRVLERDGQRKCIIDVIADIGVDDHRHRSSPRLQAQRPVPVIARPSPTAVPARAQQSHASVHLVERA